MSRSRLEFKKKIASENQTQPKAFWNYIRRKSKPEYVLYDVNRAI